MRAFTSVLVASLAPALGIALRCCLLRMRLGTQSTKQLLLSGRPRKVRGTRIAKHAGTQAAVAGNQNSEVDRIDQKHTDHPLPMSHTTRQTVLSGRRYT